MPLRPHPLEALSGDLTGPGWLDTAGSDREAKVLFAELATMADGELLLAWSSALPALDSSLVRDLEADGHLFTYRAGKPRSCYAYLVGLYQPGDSTGPGSPLPPPPIQAGPTWVMYERRDRHTCHLCGLLITDNWKRPNEFRSLDHFIPRSKGGTDYPSNIRLAHASCNKGRRNRDVAEFRAWLAVAGSRGARVLWHASGASSRSCAHR